MTFDSAILVLGISASKILNLRLSKMPYVQKYSLQLFFLVKAEDRNNINIPSSGTVE